MSENEGTGIEGQFEDYGKGLCPYSGEAKCWLKFRDENIALKEEVAQLKEKAKSFDEALQTLYLLSDKDEDEDEQD